MNGVAFNDENEVWWLETIGGHNWIAKRVKDDEYVIMPNQLGIDEFDLSDAYGKKKSHLCSKGLRDLIKKNHLDVNLDGVFNPRYALGSRSDADHIYNTPRAWFMGRYFNPNTYVWDGQYADFTPENNDIPWSMIPEKKITVEDLKYVLSSYYQGTPYDPFTNVDSPYKGHYRIIGIARTGVMGLCQIRGYMPEKLKGIHWVAYGPNPFNILVPVYANTDNIPAFLSNVSKDVVSTDNLYWSSRIIGTIADNNYHHCIQHIERYQLMFASKAHQLISEYDAKMLKAKKYNLCNEANKEICDIAKEMTNKALSIILFEAGMHMNTFFKRSDN